MNYTLKIATSVSVLALMAGTINSANAQDIASENSSFSNDEIIVTARKKEESLLEVPVAITAINSAELTSADLDNIDDIAAATPGLHIEAFQFNPGRFDSVPYIRGVVIEDDNPTQQTVSVFVDGVYVAGGTRGIGTEDLERVEVIKGPQSALFGRTTFAGAINYVTRDPSNEFGGKLSATAATRGQYELTGSIEGPIAGDALRGSISGRFYSKNGHYDNSVVSGERLGDEQTFSIGATLVAEPSDNVYLKLRGFYYEDDDGPAAASVFTNSINNFGPLSNVIVDPLSGALSDGRAEFSGTLPSLMDSQIGINSDPADIAALLSRFDASNFPLFGGQNLADTAFGLDRESGRISAQASFDLGGFDLDLLGGYNWENSLLVSDFDQTPSRGFLAINGRKFKDTSFEARLSGQSFGDKLEWAVGANYFDLDFEELQNFFAPAIGPGVFFFDGLPDATLVSNYGIFGQFEYALTDKVGLSLEGRYQWDEIDAKQTGGMDVPGAPAKFKNFLPRVTLDYQPTENALLYATYAVGNLPGGFNQSVIGLTPAQRTSLQTVDPGVQDTFGEEELENYEIGWKQSIPSSNLDFALSGFLMNRNDQQITTLTLVPDPTEPNFGVRTVSATQNAQTTEIKGFELEGNWSAKDVLKMRATLAYTDSEIKSFPVNGNAGEFEQVFGTLADPEGQSSPLFPKWQGTLSATFTEDLNMNWLGDTNANWYLRGDIFYRGKYFTGTTNLSQTPSAVISNLRWGIDSEVVGLEFFVTNLFEEDAYTAGSTVRDFTVFPRNETGYLVGLRDKRQFGVRTTFDF